MADASADPMSGDASARAAILERDSALLVAAVREAGALAHSLFRTELKNWTKGASSPVSDADIAVNDLIEKRLRSATPEYGWLSEESADDPSRLQRRSASRDIGDPTGFFPRGGPKAPGRAAQEDRA